VSRGGSVRGKLAMQMVHRLWCRVMRGQDGRLRVVVDDLVRNAQRLKQDSRLIKRIGCHSNHNSMDVLPREVAFFRRQTGHEDVIDGEEG